MIPELNIIAWSRVAPWPEPRQVEQDLIISRAVVELFNDDLLKEQLRFRGGTALHKLHFPTPLRYSEDIDLVRTTHGGIGPILDRVREVLDWLGQAGYHPSPVAPKLRFRAEAEERMFAKIANPGMLADIKPLLAADEVERLTDEWMRRAFAEVLTSLIRRLPGEPWERTGEMSERFGIALDAGT